MKSMKIMVIAEHTSGQSFITYFAIISLEVFGAWHTSLNIGNEEITKLSNPLPISPAGQFFSPNIQSLKSMSSR